MKERVVGAKTGKAKAVVKTKAKPKRIASEVTLPKPKGRPSGYTDEIGNEICQRIAEGSSLREIVADEAMPSLRTVMYWRNTNESFLQQYARAKEDQAEAYEDMMLNTARSEQDVLRARLIIDTMKWTAAKLKPKKYGDKIDMTTNGKDIPSPIFGGQSVATSDTPENL